MFTAEKMLDRGVGSGNCKITHVFSVRNNFIMSYIQKAKKLKELVLAKDEIPKELFGYYYYHCKKSRIRKLTSFIAV